MIRIASSRSPARATRSGITLLELILALMISTMILLALFTAINVQMGLFDRGRKNVEQSQLARSILWRIAGDLRSTVQTEVTDFSNVQLTDLDSVAGDLLDSSGLGDDALANDVADQVLDQASGDSSSDDGSSSADPTNPNAVEDTGGTLAAAIIPPEKPGLYGSQFELQFDVTRLPRLDEYDPTLNYTGNTRQIPSDVKTIAYYLNDNSLSGALAGAALNNMAQPGAPGNTVDGQLSVMPTDEDLEYVGPRGLIRRELDRAVTSWALNSADPSQLATGEMLAAEVVGLQFSYFDGEAWLPEWDSDSMGRLPLAIEIILAIEPTSRRGSTLADDTALPPMNFVGLTPPGSRFYRLVVHLPLADHPPEEEGSDDLTEEDFF